MRLREKSTENSDRSHVVMLAHTCWRARRLARIALTCVRGKSAMYKRGKTVERRFVARPADFSWTRARDFILRMESNFAQS